MLPANWAFWKQRDRGPIPTGPWDLLTLSLWTSSQVEGRGLAAPSKRTGEGPEFTMNLPQTNSFFFWAFWSRNIVFHTTKEWVQSQMARQPKAKTRNVCCAHHKQPKHTSLGWVLGLIKRSFLSVLRIQDNIISSREIGNRSCSINRSYYY